MEQADAGGLRDRKKRATREAIERSAIELALEHGYEHVTVDMICELAGISQRTFFNYAGTKEGAVLGAEPPLPGAALRAEFVGGRGGSVLEDLVETLAVVFAERGGPGGDLFAKRWKVIQASPELALKEFARLEEAEGSILQLVRERLRAEARGTGESDEEATMIVSLTFGILHHVARTRMAAGFPDDVGGVLRHAVGLARRVVAAPG